MASSSSGANLRVRISAELTDIKQGLALLRGELAKVKRDGDRVAPDTTKWSQALGTIRKQLAAIGGAYAALRAVRWYADQADQAANLASRLRLATKSQQEFETAYRSTYQIAQQSSADWESIVGLYAGLAQTTGMSQKGVLALTRVISQSFQVSGASAQDTANGLRQLQQALAGGVLRAEEFNTIIETSPRIVQALADHFGISFGQVRRYVNDGKVSSREFAEAMLKATGDIQSDFDKLPTTVGRATQQVRNALLAMVGDTDKATGASNSMSDAILELARTFESPDVMSGFRTFVSGVATAVGALAQLLAATARVTKAIGEGVAARVGGTSIDDTAGVEARIKRIQTTIASVRALQEKGVRGVPQFLNASELVPKDFLSRPGDVVARLQKELDKENEKLRVGTQLRQDAARAQKALGDTAASASEDVSKLLEGMTTGGGSDKSKTQKKVERLAESTALLQDEVIRAQKALDAQFEDKTIGIADYYAKRVELQQRLIDLQIAQAKSELGIATTLEQRRRLEEQIAILQRDRADVATQAAREQLKAEKELNEEKGRTLQQRYGDITGGLSATEQSISAQMAAGTLGFAEGEGRLQAARESSLAQLRELRKEQEAYLATLSGKSPEMAAAQQGLLQIDGAIADVLASNQKFRQGIADSGVRALTGFFDDLIDGAKSFQEAFRDMVREFVVGVAKMIAQELALQAVRAVLSAFGGGGAAAGAASAAAPRAAMPLMHSGGIAGQFRMWRNGIDPGAFATAPRYHGGGIAGLQSDEVAAVLRRGEVIRTQEQERALAARMDAAQAGGRGRMVTTPIVAIGDRAIADAMASSAGEEIVLTHVRNNWGGLSRGG
jgi:tape measure domain-containing protein